MKTTDLSLAELRAMLAENEQECPNASSTQLLRRIVARRERAAETSMAHHTACDKGVDTITRLSDAARSLTPDELRKRLADLDKEARVLRALLRASLRSEFPAQARNRGGVDSL